jgi:hypothetical protein
VSRTPTKDLLDTAYDATSFSQARELWTGWGVEINSPGISYDRAYELNKAMDYLEEQYPQLAKSRPDASQQGEYERRAGQARRQVRKEERAKRPSAGGSRGSRGGSRTRSSRRSRPRAPRASRAFRQTGIPGTVASTTDTLLKVAGGTIGLSLLYIFLTNAEGGKTNVVTDIAGWFTAGLRRLILPVDPLRPVTPQGTQPLGSQAAAASAASLAATQHAPAGPQGPIGPTGAPVGAPAGPSGPVNPGGHRHRRPHH